MTGEYNRLVPTLISDISSIIPKFLGDQQSTEVGTGIIRITGRYQAGFFPIMMPVLYFLHALLTGLSVFIAASMHWIAGFGFSAGLVDMVLSSRNPLAVQWYILIPQGLVSFVVYYLLFRFTIKHCNLLTPGHELQMAGDEADGYDVNIDAAGKD